MLDANCLIAIPSVIDERGGLSFAEARRTVPFAVERVFWIYGVPQTATRGGHAHWQCSEVVVAVSGSFTLVLDDGEQRIELKMDSPSQGALVEAGVWCELRDFTPDTVIVVMASHPYSPEGYVHSYEEYLKTKQR